MAWSFNAGQPFTDRETQLILDYCEGSHIAGLSLLGGEPLEFINQQGLLPLLKTFKATYPDKTVWCYTGYDFEKDVLGRMWHQWDFTPELIPLIDIIVDGKFELEHKVLDLRFRGSTNQRIIDVKASLEQEKLVLWDEKGAYF